MLQKYGEFWYSFWAFQGVISISEALETKNMRSRRSEYAPNKRESFHLFVISKKCNIQLLVFPLKRMRFIWNNYRRFRQRTLFFVIRSFFSKYSLQNSKSSFYSENYNQHFNTNNGLRTSIYEPLIEINQDVQTWYWFQNICKIKTIVL